MHSPHPQNLEIRYLLCFVKANVVTPWSQIHAKWLYHGHEDSIHEHNNLIALVRKM